MTHGFYYALFPPKPPGLRVLSVWSSLGDSLQAVIEWNEIMNGEMHAS